MSQDLFLTKDRGKQASYLLAKTRVCGQQTREIPTPTHHLSPGVKIRTESSPSPGDCFPNVELWAWLYVASLSQPHNTSSDLMGIGLLALNSQSIWPNIWLIWFLGVCQSGPHEWRPATRRFPSSFSCLLMPRSRAGPWYPWPGQEKPVIVFIGVIWIVLCIWNVCNMFCDDPNEHHKPQLVSQALKLFIKLCNNGFAWALTSLEILSLLWRLSPSAIICIWQYGWNTPNTEQGSYRALITNIRLIKLDTAIIPFYFNSILFI